ncbi:MAG: hypothetical protein LBI75_04465 [Brucellaceae bacterium]|nr:hypothetical protein [Brucellaceae bacterium]
MFKTIFKAAVVIAPASFANAETLPEQSADFQTNYNQAIKDYNARPAAASCSATAHDLTKNSKYRYDRFGFTQADYDAAELKRCEHSGTVTVKLNGEARQRTDDHAWQPVAVECKTGKDKVRSIAVMMRRSPPSNKHSG